MDYDKYDKATMGYLCLIVKAYEDGRYAPRDALHEVKAYLAHRKARAERTEEREYKARVKAGLA